MIVAAAVGMLWAFAGSGAGSALATEAGSFPAYQGAPIPDGSTLVPSRAEFDKSLGTAAPTDASPQAVASSLCQPTVAGGGPTTSPSSVDVAIGPSSGVVVSNEGYLVFDKTDPTNGTTGCPRDFTPLIDNSLFGSLVNAGTTIYSPRVAYDPHSGTFLIVALSSGGTNGLLWAQSSDGGSWSASGRIYKPASIRRQSAFLKPFGLLPSTLRPLAGRILSE